MLDRGRRKEKKERAGRVSRMKVGGAQNATDTGGSFVQVPEISPGIEDTH